MPCSFCGSQFTIFKRKRSCISCHCLYCANCFGKKKKNFCSRCESIFVSSKRELLDMKTKDLIFFLQSRKINFAGTVEKEELCNLIVSHINSSAYYDTTNASTPSSSTPNADFDNYTHSFDQIKQTCQNIFSSLSDKIASDFQKTTCFNQTAGAATARNQRDHVTTQQPRSRVQNHADRCPAGTSYARESRRSEAAPHSEPPPPPDCECSDAEEMDEICEKRQTIADDDSQRLKRTKLSNSSSINSSSFEEVVVAGRQHSDDDWLFVETVSASASAAAAAAPASTNEKPPNVRADQCPEPMATSSSHVDPPSSQTVNQIHSSAVCPTPPPLPEKRCLPHRRCSDSSLLNNMKKSSSIHIDRSLFNPSLWTESDGGGTSSSSEVKKIKVSCKKCGKAKSKIRNEILILSEQLKSANRSEGEINAKIKEFMDYLESKSQPSEMTETDSSEFSSQTVNNKSSAAAATTVGVNIASASHDDIGESIFDENEGINVYASNNNDGEFASQQPQTASCSSNQPPKRFISLGDITSSADLEMMNVKQLKEILMLNRVDFKGCCEKNELKERVQRLWESHVSAPPSDRLSSGDLCKICMDAPIECVFLECGHSLGCISCCKVLSECPICRSYIVRVVRIFKS